jgi:hypothetical protein
MLINERVAGITPPTTRVTGNLNLDRGEDKVSLKLDYQVQPGQNPFDKLVDLVTNSPPLDQPITQPTIQPDNCNYDDYDDYDDYLTPPRFLQSPQQSQQPHYQSSQPYYPVSAGMIDRGEA